MELVAQTLAIPGAPLLLRMTLVAVFVVLVALAAERIGPFLGGMLASLPLYTGPIYLMLALENDVEYLWAATLTSIAICGATPVYVLAYCIAARAHGLLVSLATALLAWGACALIVQSIRWSLVEALLFVTPIYAVAVLAARGYTRGIAVRSAGRGAFDLPLRALLCGGLAGVVITVSRHVPPSMTGILSVLPILMTSLVLVLHPRIGGPATASLLAHTLGGLVGMVLGFTLVNLTIHRLGAAVALAGGLAVAIGWNLLLILIRRLLRPRAGATPPPPPPPSRGRRTGTAAHGAPLRHSPTAR